MSLARRSCVALLALVAAPRLASGADSPRAAYATPDELQPEGLPHQLELSTGLAVTRIVDRPSADPLNGLQDIEAFTLKSRLLMGRSLAYAGGLEGYAGGSDTGAAYAATIFPVGLGLRGGRGTFVALTGGAGVERVVGSVPPGALLPAELAFAFPLGPLRPLVWARASWIEGAPERRHGSPTVSFVDELEAGLAVRLGEQLAYWARMNAGRGPSISVTYRELMGARAVGFALTLDLSGGQ